MRNAVLLSFVMLLIVGCGGGSEEPGKQDGGGTPPAEARVYAGQGIMVGEVTLESAFVQVRLTSVDELTDRDVPGAAGLVEFTLSAGDETIEVTEVEATADYDHIARAAFTGLAPGTEYTCTARIGKDASTLFGGPVATFRTLPAADAETEVSFVVVTGQNYAKFHGDDRIDLEQHKVENNTELPPPYAGDDKALGYPGLATILKKRPHFFVGTGDNVYYDTPDNPRAETVEELRQKWHEQYVQPRYRDLFAKVPTYWMIDDHDYRIDDGDNTGDYEPSPETGRRMMLEQLPVAAHGDDDAKTYRTHRLGKHLQIWFPENRMYRSPNLSEDGPDKTIWGAEQKAWLKTSLKESDATFKLLVSPTPMIGPDDARKTDNHTNIGGFRHERDEFFAWLEESGVANGNFALVCGDRHWQYHAEWPNGLEEFSCGALVDANSRLGRPPGDPKSTDPEATIVQHYTQKEPSGGFLLIRLLPPTDDEPARLRFEFYDEKGESLYEHEKTPA